MALAVVSGLTLTGYATPTAGASVDPVLAPLVAADGASAVSGRYIVVLDEVGGAARTESATDAAADRARDDGGVVVRELDSVGGYVARLTAAELREVRQDPSVAYVEQDSVVRVSQTQSPATWGLDRIDQRTLPLTNSYTYNSTGAGVRAYIIDTGLNSGHREFTGRTAPGFSADGLTTTDCHGHGTHVAGTVGGTTYGVAKAATIVPVKVLNCAGSGLNSDVIAGMDWVARNASGPSVANMSLGGGASQATDDAVARMTAAGVTVAVAAGNETQNACNVSPARAPSAITTGATTSTDAAASYSNFGPCVDVFAPGSSITSAWWTTSTSTNTISGTSMASPHVAGVAALYLQGHPSASPSQVTAAITGGATPGVVTGAGSGSPNLLLHSLI